MRTTWVSVIIGMFLAASMPINAAAEGPSEVISLSSESGIALDELATSYAGPKELAKFLHEKFRFRKDSELFGEADRWQSPEEFLAKGSGDCEDYALLAKEVLSRNGIESYVFSLFGENGYAHTVAVFVDKKGRLNAINVDKVRLYHAKSLPELAWQIYPRWTYGSIVEKEGTRGRMVSEIYNEHQSYAPEELITGSSF